MKKIQRDLRREFPFAKLETANSGHLRLRLPNGERVITSASPGCPFWMKHVRADVRRKLRAGR